MGRICFIAPIISTIDGSEIQLNIEKIANENGFNQIPLINPNRFFNKTNPKLQFLKKPHRALIDAIKGQVIKRKIFVFEKKS